jgi:hypothetical protein
MSGTAPIMQLLIGAVAGSFARVVFRVISSRAFLSECFFAELF